MLARRVIAISPDKAMAKRMSLALMASGGAVETLPSADSLAAGEIQASLVVYHVDSPDAAAYVRPVLDRLQEDAWLILVLPKSDLAEIVAVMEISDRVAGILVADTLSTETLASMATRVLYGDIFGLEKIIRWGSRVYSRLVGDYQEKSVCIAEISQFAAAMRVRRKYREAIEQCVDEMLMNALYDAPVDASGEMLFAKIPTKSRITMRLEQKAVVQYACDGKTFAVSVRDNYGTLARETVMQYLHKCIHSEDQIDRKTGGAGLGLFIMSNSSTQFIFNVLPGVATECICTFDLTAPKLQLKDFGFYEERIDATGRLIGETQLVAQPGEARAPAAVSKPLMITLSAALLLLLLLIGIVAADRFGGPDTSAVAVTTGVADCDIVVDDSPRGRTDDSGSLLVSGLEVARLTKVVARCPGHQLVEAAIKPIEDQTIAVNLDPPRLAAKLRISANIPNVSISYKGKLLGKTPTVLEDLPPGETVELKFDRTGYDTRIEKVKIPDSGQEGSYSVALSIGADFGSFQITSQPPGAEVLKNGEPIAGKATPISDVLVDAERRYTFTILKPGYQPAKIIAKVGRGERGKPITATLVPGGSITLTANIPGRVVFGEAAAARCNGRTPIENCGLANGSYRATFDGANGASHRFVIKLEGNSVELDLRFGRLIAKPGYRLRLGPRDRPRSEVAALHDEKIEVQYAREGTNKWRSIVVRPRAGKPIPVPP